jgi:hypothetical protein
MTSARRERYFVRRLDDASYRPTPDAEFEIVVEDDAEDRDICAYVGRDSNKVIALIHATTKGPVSLPVEGHGIPEAVIEAARQRRVGYGEYVDENGEIVNPSFLPPWS